MGPLPWIHLYADWPGHPKARFVIARLRDPMGCWYVAQLWCFASQKYPDGNLSTLSEAEIAGFSGWGGDPSVFVQALRDARLLDDDGMIHDWPDINPAHVSAAQKEQAEAAQLDAETGGGLELLPIPPECSAQERKRRQAVNRNRKSRAKRHASVSKTVSTDTLARNERIEERNGGDGPDTLPHTPSEELKTGETREKNTQNERVSVSDTVSNERNGDTQERHESVSDRLANKPDLKAIEGEGIKAPKTEPRLLSAAPRKPEKRWSPTEEDIQKLHARWREKCDPEGRPKNAHYTPSVSGSGYLIAQAWRSPPISAQADPRQAMFDALEGFISKRWRMAPGQLVRRDLHVFLRPESLSDALSAFDALEAGHDPNVDTGSSQPATAARREPDFQPKPVPVDNRPLEVRERDRRTRPILDGPSRIENSGPLAVIAEQAQRKAGGVAHG